MRVSVGGEIVATGHIHEHLSLVRGYYKYVSGRLFLMIHALALSL